MTVRIVASIVILLGCAYLGILFAASFRKRVKQLEELCFIINQMDFDIDFLNIPLSESLKRISGMCEGGVKRVVEYVRMGMNESKCLDMHGLWKKAFERFEYDLALNESDKNIILDFSKNLGSGDRIREKNNIKAATMRLEVACREAKDYATTNSRMYRGLGILAGIFIVIVLF